MKKWIIVPSLVAIVIIAFSFYWISTNPKASNEQLDSLTPARSAATPSEPKVTPIKSVPSVYFRDLLRTGPFGDQNMKQAAAIEAWDFPPPGDILVGFEYTMQTGQVSSTAVTSLRGIFRRGEAQRSGILQGKASASPLSAVAKPGYVVGGIEVRGRNQLQGFRLLFMRMAGDQLMPDDAYAGDWVGNDEIPEISTAQTDGAPIIGFSTRSSDRVLSLSFFTRPATRGQAPASNQANATAEAFPASRSEGSEMALLTALGNDRFEVYLNGTPMLRGDKSDVSYARSLYLSSGDIIAARIHVASLTKAYAALNLQVDRPNQKVINLSDLRCTQFPSADWKTNSDLRNWQSLQLVTAPNPADPSAPYQSARVPKSPEATSDYVFIKAIVP